MPACRQSLAFLLLCLAPGALAAPTTTSFGAPALAHGAARLTGRVIFSTLGSPPQFNCCTSYDISGPNSGEPTQYVAAAFTPRTDARVTEIDAVLNLLGGSVRRATIGLYADRHGVPGALLQSGSAKALRFYQGVIKMDRVSGGGIPVKAGQVYWVGVTLPPRAQGTYAGWNLAGTTSAPTETIAGDHGGGWGNPGPGSPPAFAVYGR